MVDEVYEHNQLHLGDLPDCKPRQPRNLMNYERH